MKRAIARILEHEQLYADTYRVWLEAPEISRAATAGTFAMVKTPAAYDTYWPRALSFHRFRPGPGNTREFSFLYRAVGRGTRWLSDRVPGETLALHGPLGHGFRVHPGSRHLLLVAGGIGVAPLVGFAEEHVERGHSVTLLMGARTAAELYPAIALPPEVEFVVATEDGSAGHHGLATDLFRRHITWADQAFACGPDAMFRAMAPIAEQERRRLSVQVLVEQNMACGTGICYGCAVETRKGVRLVCKDGPRFELRDLAR